jgi:hypothetical protein
MPPRNSRLARSPTKRKPRKASERERIYGPKGRVEFVQSLPCIVCGAVPSENAHTEGSGMGRKADARTIAPMCGEFQNGCHAAYDRHLAPFDNEERREWAKGCAAGVEALWQERSGGPEHISSIVKRVMGAITDEG